MYEESSLKVDRLVIEYTTTKASAFLVNKSRIAAYSYVLVVIGNRSYFVVRSNDIWNFLTINKRESVVLTKKHVFPSTSCCLSQVLSIVGSIVVRMIKMEISTYRSVQQIYLVRIVRTKRIYHHLLTLIIFYNDSRHQHYQK